MPFIFTKTVEKPTLKTKSNDELFEMYMLEIGQYSIDDMGNILITGPYIKASEITAGFRDWVKKLG